MSAYENITPNACLSGHVIGLLAGVDTLAVVICAGARNAPLVASLLGGGGQGWHIYHHFDERAAAFFALGLAKKEGRPVAIVTTSGTAVGELLPAVIEAYYSSIPLILVSADRPRVYRGSGAPQAIEQKGIFGVYAETHDLAMPNDLATLRHEGWDRRSPLHLNICLEEPQPEDRAVSWKPEQIPTYPQRLISEDVTESSLWEHAAAFCEEAEGEVLVVLGDMQESWREPVRTFLSSLRTPIWAEATSGLREEPSLLDRMVRDEPRIPQSLLRIGGIPSLRLWRDLESGGRAERTRVLSISHRPFSGLARKSELIVPSRIPDFRYYQSENSEFDSYASMRRRDSDDEQDFCKHPGSELTLVRELSCNIQQNALIFLGNSLPIREWNLAAVDHPPHSRCCASRGANGIDGQIATFLGLSEGEEEAWGIFGDLTALYDLNAPNFLNQLQRGIRRIVVINNEGGRIFTQLRSMANLSIEERYIAENRHSRRFDQWAAMWGIEYRLWNAGEPFPSDLPPAVVIEARPDNFATEQFWKVRHSGKSR